MRPTNDIRPARRRLLAFFILACGLSWADWGLVIASDRGLIPFKVGLNPWGSFGPAAAAIIVALAAAGRRGLRDLFRPITRWRFALRWWVLIVFLPVFLVAAATAMYACTGGQVFPAASPNYAQLALMSLVLFILGGPLGEEIGWRGYALPGLLERMGPVPASLVIAVMWGAWHLPLFWMPGSAQSGASIPVFLGLVTAFAVLTTWVYVGTGKSLLAAMVFHHFINLSTYFLPTIFPSLESAPGVDRMLLVVTWLAAGVALWAMSRKPRPALVKEPRAGLP